MGRAPAAPASRDRLRWARAHAGLSVDEAARRVNVTPARLRSWEDGPDSPTINQLRNLAKTYRQTIASLFTPAPPQGADSDDDDAVPDFRGLVGGDEKTDAALRREINRAEDRRKALRDLQPPSGALPPVGDLVEEPAQAAGRFLHATDIPGSSRFRDSREALAFWIQQLERLGVLVFQMSRVDPDNCRGVSLWHDRYPIIILNGADEPEARLFTLLHETGHLLIHQSGLCGVLAGPEIESRCNEFAGAVLVPQNEAIMELGQQDAVSALPRLARTFRVSQSAVAIRLRSLGLLDQATLRRQLGIAIRLSREKRERDREEAKRKGGGPPHHLTHLRNLGGRYVSAVLEALDDEAISPVDAAYFLESKLPTIDHMRTELVRRGGNQEGIVASDEFAAQDG